jgi:uncharacterized protein (DUF427 family)
MSHHTPDMANEPSTEPATESVWDYPRPPRVESDARTVSIEHRGMVLVTTNAAVRVLETSHPPVFYLPIDDVADGALVPSARRTFCEFKGTASYFDVIAGDERITDAAWTYERPAAGYEELAGHVAFYPGRFDRCTVAGVVVDAQPGDFYGGWITPDVAGPFKGAPGTAGW